MVDDLYNFRTVLLLSNLPYENFNLIVKQSVCSTLKRLKTPTGNGKRNFDSELSRQHLSAISEQQAHLL